jgi:hypothetical protein
MKKPVFNFVAEFAQMPSSTWQRVKQMAEQFQKQEISNVASSFRFEQRGSDSRIRGADRRDGQVAGKAKNVGFNGQLAAR